MTRRAASRATWALAASLCACAACANVWGFDVLQVGDASADGAGPDVTADKGDGEVGPSDSARGSDESLDEDAEDGAEVDLDAADASGDAVSPTGEGGCPSCSTSVANASAVCVSSACTFACNSGYNLCNGACLNEQTDRSNCGGCGPTFACTASETCESGQCTVGATSVAEYACTFGTCNGTSNECTSPEGCFCSDDNQCKSNKCVSVVGENDVSCGTNCTGSGLRDGFDCELASPGIPGLAGAGYECPLESGYKGTLLSCDPTHTNCYCTSDAQCPNGKCIPSTNNAMCSPGGPCSGGGAADYRGCEPLATIGNCPIYIGCGSNATCSYPTCYCTSDSACGSGHCIPSSHNGNCSGCTGTGTDDGHGCQPTPTSVACMGSGGGACTTTLTPAPIINSGQTACLCVADSDCSSGKCVNADGQCVGVCTGTGPSDTEACQTATSAANEWSCAIGNCSDVTSPGGQCTAVGVPCWCTSDSECPGGLCVNWAGCASGACTGSGGDAGVDAFNCSP